jgi:outer membrane biosynthesis protein TonB
MMIKTGISILLSAIVMALSPNVAMAVEKTGSSSSIAAWPLVLLIVVIIIFRKKIFAESTPEPEHQEELVTPEPAKPVAAKQEPVKQQAVKKEAVKKAPAKPQAAKKATPAKKPASKPKATSGPIDLTTDGKQCQASTAKGTRCKRTTTLENITTTVEGKTYQLTVCTQHNNDKLKIFSELLK